MQSTTVTPGMLWYTTYLRYGQTALSHMLCTKTQIDSMTLAIKLYVHVFDNTGFKKGFKAERI
jgi:hypothetical protein